MTWKKSFLAFTLILLLFAPEVMHAQSSFGDTASKFFGGMIEIFTVLNWIALAIVQALLNPDFIFGAKLASGIRPMEMVLNQIWIVSRDIVNGIFAFMLLIFGVYMIIFGAEKGVGAMLKEKAPKFVLAVVLVNFSWFFPRVILDMANVGQAVIYQLPGLIAGPTTQCIAHIDPGEDGKKGTPALDKDNIVKSCDFVWKVRLFPPTAKECLAVPAPPGCPRPTPTSPFPRRGQQIGPLLDIYYTDWWKVLDGKFENGTAFLVSGADTVINGLAVNFAKMPQLARVEFERAGDVSDTHADLMGKSRAYLKFFVYLAFHAILSMAIGLILIAFAAVLFVRVAVIWLCVAFMPFIFVGYAWKGALGDLGHEKAPNIWQKFIKYALLPVFVAIPLSIGFTLLSFSGYLSNFSALNMAGSIKVDGMEHIITGISEIHELIWLFLTLGIIWAGTFSVLESDEYSAKIIGGIKGIGEGGMRMAKKSLMYAPVIPFPGKDGGIGVGHLLDMGRGMSHGQGLWDADDYLAKMAQGPVAGTSAFAPTPDRIKAIADGAGIPPDQFQELARILKDTKAGNAQTNLDEFARKLEEITRGKKDSAGNSIAVSQEQAKAIALNPASIDHFLEGLKQKNLITPADATEIKTKAQHFVNVSHRHKVALEAGDTSAAQMVQKTKNALQTNVPVPEVIHALTAHFNERSERGLQVEARKINEIIDALENSPRTGANVDQALQDVVTRNP